MEVHLPGPGHAATHRPSLRLTRLSDEHLARLVGTDDQRAFAALYRRYHQQLYRYCRSILRHDADAQDALQSTFARAFSALEHGRRDAPPRPWLFRIAHNESVTLLRRRRAQLELSEGSERSTRSAAESAEEREQLSTLMSDLLELPERQRGALVMRELSGLSHEEIAIALGTSVGAAKQTIFEARRSLFEYAEGRAMPCEEIRRMISDADRRSLRGRGVRAHLRDCASCAAFAGAIPARRAELRALAPPLATAATTPLLARILGRSASQTGGTPSVAAAATGKTVGAGLAAKALAGLVVASAATVGVTKAVEHVAAGSTQPAAPARAHRSAAVSAAARARPRGRRLPANQGSSGLPVTSRSGAASSARRPSVALRSSARVSPPPSSSSTHPNGIYAPGRAGSAPRGANGQGSRGGQGSARFLSTTGRYQARGLGKGSSGPGKRASGPGNGAGGLGKSSGGEGTGSGKAGKAVG